MKDCGNPLPFRLQIGEDAIVDLHERLARTRFADEPPDQSLEQHWRYGTNNRWLRELLGFWRESFDWRAEEAALNRFPQYRVDIDGQRIHFLHVAAAPGQLPSRPLLLLHGWPGSVFEFLELIPLLSQQRDEENLFPENYTLIVASLPGFGLSFTPGQQRVPLQRMGDLLHALMHKVLGYPSYLIQGGDWGSFIASDLAFRYPKQVEAIHLNFLPLRRDALLLPENEHPEEARYAAELATFLREEAGYQAIQGTRPQTLAYALTDSPAGLAAWIGEKFQRWSDCTNAPEEVIARSRILANISLYWFTAAIGSSFWPYYTRARTPWFLPAGEAIEVPMGYCQFPREILKPPQRLAERSYRRIVRWTEAERGGHFAALEQPQVLAHEIRASFAR